MKSRRKSFRVKLWSYFALLAIALLAILWVLQTVFLQAFYDGAVKDGVRQAAAQIEESWARDDPSAFSDVLDDVASDKSLLVLVTDWDGTVLYSADEHSDAYRQQKTGDSDQGQNRKGVDGSRGLSDGSGSSSDRAADGGTSNASAGSASSSEAVIESGSAVSSSSDGSFAGGGRSHHGQGRNLTLTTGFDEFLSLLKDSTGGVAERQDDDGLLYMYGMTLPVEGAAGSACEQAGREAVLYINTTLQPVGAAASVIRLQLVVASVVALLLAFALGFVLSRGFSQPVEALTRKAERLAHVAERGDCGLPSEDEGFQKGFCSELDELASALDDASVELAQVEERRREFLANISHDLRTPLTLIRGYAEAARDDADADDGTLEEDLGIIVREADRLSALVNEVLDYSVLQGDVVQFRAGPFDASAMMESVVDAFAQVCERDGLQLSASIEKGVTVIGDEPSLTRVAYNLVDNAVSHTPEGETVTVSLVAQGDTARFEVRDCGEGIPADELDHVWDRYFTKKQAKRNSQGSGLGLAISKAILESHHARYGVESVQSEGSLFWFEMPSITQS